MKNLICLLIILFLISPEVYNQDFYPLSDLKSDVFIADANKIARSKSAHRKRMKMRDHILLNQNEYAKSYITNDSVYIEWIKHYASEQKSTYDYLDAIVVDTEGNIYATGNSTSTVGDGNDYVTVKYNSLGQLQWSIRYDYKNSYESAGDIKIDYLGNIIVTGESYGEDNNSDIATIKYSPGGEQLWVARYKGQATNFYDGAEALAIDKSNNIYIAGSTGYYPEGSYYPLNDFLVIKYSSDGEQQWVATYNGPVSNSYDIAYAIVVDDSGNVYVTGESNGDIATIKYNTNGEQQWVSRFNGPRNDDDYPNAIAIDDSGNIYVTGNCDGETRSNFVTIKYNSAGENQWVAMYNGPANRADEATAIVIDKFGYIYVTGVVENYNNTFDYATIKYNSNGELQWVVTYNGEANKNDFAESITVDDSGNVYVTGGSVGLDGSYDFLTIKYDQNGESQWTVRYNGPRNEDDEAIAIKLDNENNVIVGGASIGTSGSKDYTIIKYNSSGNQEWLVYYNEKGLSEDILSDISMDSQGNIYITGKSRGDTTYNDILTIKYNSSGDMQWIARYNGPIDSTDEPSRVIVDEHGNVYVTGTSKGYQTDFDFVTIKYNSLGQIEWVARYNGPDSLYDAAIAIALDDSGNVYVTGSSRSYNTSSDFLTIKYNSAGEQQWVKKFDGSYNGWDEAKDIAVDNQGNIYVTGSIRGLYGRYYFTTIKYNGEGDQQWVSMYVESNYSGSPSKITIDDSGYVYITGSSYRTGTSYDYETVKYNSNGEQLWAARYNGPKNSSDGATDIIVDKLGNVYVTGYSTGINGNYDYATVKYNSSGEEQWVARYDGIGANPDDSAIDITMDSSGSIYVTGRSDSSPNKYIPSYDFVTIKYNPNGIEQWSTRYNGPGNKNDIPVGIEIDASGNIYVAGTSVYKNNRIFTTIKYGQVITSISQLDFLPQKFELYQNYPNPFNPTTTIQFDIPQVSFVTLKIFNLLGQEVATLVDEEKQAGRYEVKFNGSTLSNGVYFYRLKDNDFVATKKLLLIK